MNAPPPPSTCGSLSMNAPTYPVASRSRHLGRVGRAGLALAVLGPAKALAVAIGWPLLLGTGSLLIAGRSLRRSDLVA